MDTPAYYKSIYRIYLRFSLIMLAVALLVGIATQESAKKAPISALLPAGNHVEATLHLSLVHGHIFLIGVLIPLALTWMLYLGLSLKFAPLSEKSLKWATRLYLPAAALAIGLMLYKGYHFILGVRSGITDIGLLNDTLFMGNHALRAAAYGLTHTAMSIGVFIFIVSYWRSMGKEANA